MSFRNPLLFALVVALSLASPSRVSAQQADPDKPLPTTPSGPEAAKRDADRTLTGQEVQRDEDESKEADYVNKRREWFYQQREYPFKTIPQGIRAQAVRQVQDYLRAEAALRASISPATSLVQPTWNLIGPKPITGGQSYGGRITSLAIDPVTPTTIYAGAAEGGVWKSVDAGAHWLPITDTQASLAVGAITIDPTNHNIIYVGTGEDNFSGDSYYGAGILKSTDGGATWAHYTSVFTANYAGGEQIGAIAVDPANNQILLAAVNFPFYGVAGIYRSTDGGQTWAGTYNAGGYNPGTNIFFDPVTPTIAYAALYQDTVLKSTNSGATWAPIAGSGATALPNPTTVGRIALAIAPSQPSTLYAAVSGGNDLIGLYKTTDAGASWHEMTGLPNFCATQCWYDIVLAVSPTNPNLVAAGGVYPYHPGGSAVTISQDGGTTWTDQSSGLHPDTHALAFTPDGTKLYVGNDGGVWSTTSATATTIPWTNLNATFAIAEYYPGLSMDQANVKHALVGSQDNGTEIYKGSLSWPNVACGDGGSTLIDQVSTSTLYTNCIEESIYKSTDNGNTWNWAGNGLYNDPTGWVPPLASDSKTHTILYFGTNRIYQSKDSATTWNPISSTIVNPADTSGYGVLSTIAVAPTDSNTIYAGSNDGGMFVSRNALSGASSTWTQSMTGLPNRAVTWVAVDHFSPSIAYVGFSGFTGYGDSLGHIFRTTTAGASWTDISSNLPNTPVNAILVDPDLPSTIFVGTDIGAFYTTNTGGSWATLGAGLPNTVVTGLGLHEATRTLRASTHGRSVWDLNVATLLSVPTVTTISPVSAVANSAAITLTVNGDQFASNSIVEWAGTPLSTTFVSINQLTAHVPVSLLTGPGSYSIGVINGAGGRLSNTATFKITGLLATLTAVSPTTLLANDVNATITATGTNFYTDSKIAWKGSSLATTFVSATQLTGTVPATALTTPGTYAVTVLTPGVSGTSAAINVAVNNPLPTITSLSPISSTLSSSAFTLTVNGSGFDRSSSVHWNGAPLATTFSSGVKLTAVVPAADRAVAGVVAVTVANPAPGGGTSAAVSFPVNTPKPTLGTLSPTSATHGAAGLTLTVNGVGFLTGAQVLWNGTPLTTTFVSSARITAAVPVADLAAAGSISVTVTNPAPTVGPSAALTFTVK